MPYIAGIVNCDIEYNHKVSYVPRDKKFQSNKEFVSSF